ncbi:RDD family protein [Amphritea sp.]|uniref:RDD family protein n=1 Tax=Amphritea sp. TaxID=1872502 RepID=UPI003D0FCE14
MSDWQILGIDNTTDLKVIKRAYAAKLKVTKPDEDPEGFKRLHAAYKQACQFAKNTATADKQVVHQRVEEPPEIETQRVETQPIDKSITTAEQPQSEEYLEFVLDAPEEPSEYSRQDYRDVQPYQQELEGIASADRDAEHAFLKQQWLEITVNVDEITASDKSINEIEAWAFLNDREALLDIQFKSELSDYTFGSLADHLGKTAKPVLNHAVFMFLDNLFQWSDRRDLLEDEFGHEAVETVMQAVAIVKEPLFEWTSPKVHVGEMVPCHYFSRLLATLLDWLLLGFIAVLLSKMGVPLLSTDNDGGILDFIGGVLFYLLLAPVMEASPLQGTPGKILFGMKVVDKQGKRLNILHTLLRSFMFMLALITFKVTIWINIFFRDQRLLHDRFSYSRVIER